MALLQWLNADLFSVLRDKVNAIVDFCNNLSDQTGVGFIPVGGKLDWWGNPNDLTMFDANGNGLDDTEMEGYAQCLGQALPTGESLLKNYDGSARTAAPNASGRVPVGWSSGDSDFNQTGKTGGAKTVALIIANMPAHTHSYSDNTFTSDEEISNGGSGARAGSNNNGDASRTTGSAGSGTAHNNLQPYMTWIVLIRFK